MLAYSSEYNESNWLQGVMHHQYLQQACVLLNHDTATYVRTFNIITIMVVATYFWHVVQREHAAMSA